MLIGMANGKGGCSKSTTAFHLAHWWSIKGKRVLLVDMDPQQSSSFWLQASDLDIPFEVMPPDSDVILDRLPSLVEQFDVVVADGPAGLSDAIRSILFLSEMALIPVQASGADVRAAADAVRLVHQARRIRGGQPEARLFISRATRGTRLLAEARSVLSQFDEVPLLETSITQRQCVADAFGQATSVLSATTGPAFESGNEFNRLFSEVFPDA